MRTGSKTLAGMERASKFEIGRHAPPRRLTADDVPQAAAALAAAFHNDPIVGEWFFPDEARRADRLRRYFESEIRHVALKHGECLTNEDLSGAALWLPPGHWKIPTGTMLRLVPRMVSLFGVRLLLVGRALATIEKLHPREPHFYLPYVGVDPAHHNRGIGSSLIESVLSRCDAEGVGAYLEASSEDNKRLYSRLGFEVMSQVDLPKGPPFWPMWRSPTMSQAERPPSVPS